MLTEIALETHLTKEPTMNLRKRQEPLMTSHSVVDVVEHDKKNAVEETEVQHTNF